MNNSKNGNHTIKHWFNVMNKQADCISVSVSDDKGKSIVTKINEIIAQDDEDNLLADQFEEDIIENLDDINMDYIDIID
jgi:hypothetical protein